MADLAIGIEANVALTVGANAVLAAANTPARLDLTIQNQTKGILWVKLGGVASVDDGFKVGPGSTVTLTEIVGKGAGTDLYRGAINGFLESNRDDQNAPITTGVARVLEFE